VRETIFRQGSGRRRTGNAVNTGWNLRLIKAKTENSVSAVGVDPQLTISQQKESDHDVQ
jgi:hypothetical protein